MKRRFKALSLIICLLITASIKAQVNTPVKDNHNIVNEKTNEKTIRFYYDDEDLVDVINYLAAQKGVNVILPVGPNAIGSRLTLHMEEKLTLEQVWDLLYTILDVAGYGMSEREPNTFAIIKTTKEIIKGALPVYVHVDPDDLPDTDQRIRFLYFLSNIKVSEEAESELQGLLTGMLPPEVSSFKVDAASNALIILAKASEIRSVMRIVRLLEKTTYKEKMELVKLQHVLASVAANLFNENILKTPAERHRYGVDTKKPSEITYFSKYVKVIADDRINALIVVGREQAVLRIKDFIRKYIDVPLDSGTSILHIYRLQYLDAATFEPVIQKIVESVAPGGTGQAQAEGSSPAGIERYFEGVIIRADAPKAEGEEATAAYKGTNRLIIAARNSDWIRIEKLIEELDVPQPQVILQVLVADLTLDDVRLVGSLLRNPEKILFPKGVDFQAANIGAVVVDSIDTPKTVAADLLRDYYTQENGSFKVADSDEAANKSFADTVAGTNSTLLSLSDCTNCWTWAILQFINTLGYKKILSLPHIIAVSNKRAEIVIGEERFVDDAAVGNQGGSVTATKKWIPANMLINLKPRIAYGEKAQALTLDIEVKIDDFKESGFQNADKVTREFKTTSIVSSGDVIALGGLARVTDSDTANETPLLGKVPILGYLFKRRYRDSPKTSLTVFIRPTVVQPKMRGGMGEYTQDYIKLTKRYAKEGMLFDSLKDPITRWFFKPESMAEDAIADFVAGEELKNQEVEEKLADQTELPKNKEGLYNENNPKERTKIARRRKKSIFDGRDDKLDQLLADQENPFSAA